MIIITHTRPRCGTVVQPLGTVWRCATLRERRCESSVSGTNKMLSYRRETALQGAL